MAWASFLERTFSNYWSRNWKFVKEPSKSVSTVWFSRGRWIIGQKAQKCGMKVVAGRIKPVRRWNNFAHQFHSIATCGVFSKHDEVGSRWCMRCGTKLYFHLRVCHRTDFVGYLLSLLQRTDQQMSWSYVEEDSYIIVDDNKVLVIVSWVGGTFARSTI